MTSPVVVGLIADTHGLIRPTVHEALAGVSLIFHAGDVCGDDVLLELETIATVFAVAGNCDLPGDPRLPLEVERVVAGVAIHVSHGHELGAPTPARLLAAYAADVIVYGHTHRPLVHNEGRRLVINPGAAGPRRFDLRPTVARLTLSEGTVDAVLVPLD